MTWEELKKRGSQHYQDSDVTLSPTVEPIDLYKAGGMLRDFALASIIKYAYRNRKGYIDDYPVSIKDMEKIRHYADMLIVLANEEKPEIEITDEDRILDSVENRLKHGL